MVKPDRKLDSATRAVFAEQAKMIAYESSMSKAGKPIDYGMQSLQ